jgi:Na+/H+ antiporter NhaC
MDFLTSQLAFNIFIMVLLGWFYFYFFTMIKAVLDFNEDLINHINGVENTETDEMQTKLDKWLDSEEE